MRRMLSRQLNLVYELLSCLKLSAKQKGQITCRSFAGKIHERRYQSPAQLSPSRKN